MRRLLLIATSVAILLATLAPAALAADPAGVVPVSATGALAVTVDGTLDVPAGSSIRSAVVIDGTATIAGSLDSVVLLNGSATLSGAQVRHLVIVDGSANLVAGTAVGDVATLHGTVTRDASTTISGRTTSLEAGAAALGLLLIPLGLLFMAGMAVAALVAGLLVAAFGARQVRELEDRISRRPGHVLLAGIAGSIALPLLGGLLTVTVIGAPVGLALLLVGAPVLGFLGWLVAAVWVGDWIIERAGGSREARHPYKAATIGVIVLALASILPLVSGVATVFGLGAILLAGWDAVRPEQPAAPTAPVPGAPDAPTTWGVAPTAG